jgi:N-acetylneuraminic acid mutarotase
MALLVTGVGPDLPGPRLREALGLADNPGWVACEPAAEQDRTPPGGGGRGGRWAAEPDLPEPRDELRVAAIGDQVYIGGGNGVDEDGNPHSLSSFGVFDAARGRYASLPDLPVGLDHPLMVAHDGDVYVAGGASNGDPQTGLYRFSPHDEAWTELASMRTGRFAPAGAVIGDRLYVAGGAVADREQTFSSMEIYDFETDRWREGTPMPSARHHAAATALGGSLYVAGGRVPGDFSLDAFERYDPESETWRELPPLPDGVGGLAAVAAEGRAVVVGGGDDLADDGIPPWVTGAVWAFDREREGWARLPDLRVPRHGHAATVAGGRIIVFGGAPCAGYGRTSAVESLPIAEGRA